MGLIALIVACVALGLATRAYLTVLRLRKDFDDYRPNPLYGSRQ